MSLFFRAPAQLTNPTREEARQSASGTIIEYQATGNSGQVMKVSSPVEALACASRGMVPDFVPGNERWNSLQCLEYWYRHPGVGVCSGRKVSETALRRYGALEALVLVAEARRESKRDHERTIRETGKQNVSMDTISSAKGKSEGFAEAKA